MGLHMYENREYEKGHLKLVEKEGLIAKWHWDNWLPVIHEKAKMGKEP